MKVHLTFEITEDALKALANYYGKRRITRKSVLIWADAVIGSSLEGIVSDYEANRKNRKAR